MSAIDAKRIYCQDEAGHDTDVTCAIIHPASEQSVLTVLGADPNAEHGLARSQWVWVRLQNGDLILGCFPQDDTYFATEDDNSAPRGL